MIFAVYKQLANVFRVKLWQLLLESIGSNLPRVMYNIFELRHGHPSKKLERLYNGIAGREQDPGYIIDLPDEKLNDSGVVRLDEEYEGGLEEVKGVNIAALEDRFYQIECFRQGVPPFHYRPLLEKQDGRAYQVVVSLGQVCFVLSA